MSKHPPVACRRRSFRYVDEISVIHKNRDSKSGIGDRCGLTACVVAAIMVPYCYALGAIIFHGPLAAFAVRGGSLMLAGTAVLTLIVALTSGFRGALPSPTPTRCRGHGWCASGARWGRR